MTPDEGVVDPTARLGYDGEGLDDDAVAALAGVPPLALLERWYAEAVADDRVVEPGAMVVATVDPDGRPNARTVLLKGMDARGLTFFTNLSSGKARELAGRPVASLVLLWHPMFRQVRVRGDVESVAREEAQDYFASRPPDSRLASRASRQSEPVGSRAALEAAVDAERLRWGDGDVPMPDYWGGYLVRPWEIELWVGRTSRLHDRLLFSAPRLAPLDDAGAWRMTRLQP